MAVTARLTPGIDHERFGGGVAMLKRALGVVLTTTALLGASMVAPTQQAQAYSVTGCRFSSSTIGYSIYLPTTSAYYSLAKQSAADWTATTTPIVFSQKGDCDRPDPGGLISVDDYGSTGADGTTRQVCSNGRYSSFGSYWNTYYTSSYGSNARRSVMNHELGHALGLKHAGSSTCSGQPIMYPYSSRYATCGHISPQTDDINGVNYIY
jgi:hypothetical protein